MARFYGRVGYSLTGTLVKGVWQDGMVERPYYGDILNETSSRSEGDKVNDDLRLSQRISIVADEYALGNYAQIKYVTDEVGISWAVTSVEVKRPRLILSSGGVYHGAKPATP